MITPTYYIDWRSRAGRKALDECPYLPLAMAEATKFYRKQERGRFRFEDLLPVATKALVTSKGVNYAKKAIRGALLDHARDGHKLVSDVEMSEAEFRRTRTTSDDLPKKRAAKVPPRVHYEDGGRVTVYPPGPYRTNAQLLAGDGKVSTKHNKVPIAIAQLEYKDGWSQKSSGQVRAKIEADKQEKADPKHHKQAPGSMALLLDSPEGKPPEDGLGQADYTGHGRKQRFSGGCHNKKKDYKFGLEPTGWSSHFCNGKVKVNRVDLITDDPGVQRREPLRRAPVAPIRRTAAEPALSQDQRQGLQRRAVRLLEEAVKRRSGRPRVDMTKFGLVPVTGGKAWEAAALPLSYTRDFNDLCDISACSWHVSGTKISGLLTNSA